MYEERAGSVGIENEKRAKSNELRGCMKTYVSPGWKVHHSVLLDGHAHQVQVSEKLQLLENIMNSYIGTCRLVYRYILVNTFPETRNCASLKCSGSKRLRRNGAGRIRKRCRRLVACSELSITEKLGGENLASKSGVGKVIPVCRVQRNHNRSKQTKKVRGSRVEATRWASHQSSIPNP